MDIEDHALLGNKTGATRLGFVALLKFFRQEGRFPQHKNEIPGIVLTFLATQVQVPSEAYLQYAWQGCTIEYHRAQIREALGFRESSVTDGEQMQEFREPLRAASPPIQAMPVPIYKQPAPQPAISKLKPYCINT
ncbi:hypothetical protein KDI_55010 [Dictyobacter arantiisoli]|uniref:DUF4158 domain-containing protein n=1 Tax=Dictyobacter arantiisoli TaxID=2014874 RepID=A0A5A5TKG0_9CHLR|nr:hypothetical protein KDI_55010 [Dictyobacter arantiisoli]